MTDDLTRERLSRDLRSAAREIRLEPGSELNVMATGKRRKRRRNRVTAVAAVGAVAVGAAFVVQRLSQTDDTSIQIGEGEEYTDDSTEGVPAPPDTPPPTAPLEPETTTPPVPEEQPEEAGAADDIDAPLAELVESNYVWRVVEPDAAEAVGMAVYSNPWTDFGNGILLSTAPGRSDNFEPTFWRSDDGITWTQYDIEVPFGGRQQIVFDGSSVYTVGTAPGIAKTAPNPLSVAWSDDEGVTWNQTELPIDTNAGSEVPMIGGVGVSSSVHPLDEGGVIVLVQRYANLDWEALSNRLTDFGHDPERGFMDQDSRGIHVLDDPSCEMDNVSPVVGPTVTTVPMGGEYVARGEIGGCPLRVVTWEELGVPAEAVALISSPIQQAFHIVHGEVTEVPMIEGTSQAWLAPDGDGPLVVDRLGQHYRVTATGVVEEHVDLPTGASMVVGSSDTAEFAVSEGAAGVFTPPRQRVAARSGGEWAWSDWSSLVDENRMTYTYHQAATPSGLVSVLNSIEDPILAQGGVSVTIDGVRVSRASQRVEPELVIEATGEVVPFERLQYSERGMDVLDADGNRVAELTGPDFERAMWGCCVERPDQRMYVATTADGRHVAVESIAELLGVADSDVASVTRITPVGQTVVIAVSLQDRHPDGSHRQVVLVGTPAT